MSHSPRSVQVLLEQHRRMVATAPFASPDASAQDERIYRELNATIAGLIDHIAPDRTEKLSQRFALLASQGSSVFELARHQQRDQAIAVGVRYASAADGLSLKMLTEARRHIDRRPRQPAGPCRPRPVARDVGRRSPPW